MEANRLNDSVSFLSSTDMFIRKEIGRHTVLHELGRGSMGLVLLEPGKGHTTHNHPGVEEILYVISGEGEQDVAGDRRKVGPGTLIHVPPDVFHETINTGWEQMKIIAIYAPPGPEAELRAMPECEIIPPGE